LAVLDCRRQLETALRDLDARVNVAQERLALVRAGAKKADLDAQRAEVARLEAALANARAEADRYEELTESRPPRESSATRNAPWSKWWKFKIRLDDNAQASPLTIAKSRP